jgi:hypothetical protein
MSGISVHPNAPFSRMKQNVVEGFTDNTDDVFKNVLVMAQSNFVPSRAPPGRSSGTTNTNSGTCPPAGAVAAGGAGGAAGGGLGSAYTPPPFLKQMILDEQKAVESLLRTAAKIGPIANTLVESENAADAAFVAKVPAPIPTYGSTLQGFTFILFFWSYISLAIVVSIYINQTTGNTINAVGTFIGSIVALVIIFSLMKRYA